jgi:hypothetical protein
VNPARSLNLVRCDFKFASNDTSFNRPSFYYQLSRKLSYRRKTGSRPLWVPNDLRRSPGTYDN